MTPGRSGVLIGVGGLLVRVQLLQVLFPVDARSVGPQAFEIVHCAGFGEEGVHNDVAVILELPGTCGIGPFGSLRPIAAGLHHDANFVQQSRHGPRVGRCRDDKIIDDRGDRRQIQDDGVPAPEVFGELVQRQASLRLRACCFVSVAGMVGRSILRKLASQNPTNGSEAARQSRGHAPGRSGSRPHQQTGIVADWGASCKGIAGTAGHGVVHTPAARSSFSAYSAGISVDFIPVSGHRMQKTVFISPAASRVSSLKNS